MTTTVHTDVLVVGAGLAGLRTRVGRAAAKRILFSDKSFPTPATHNGKMVTAA